MGTVKSSNFWWLLTVAGGLLIVLGFFSLTSPLRAYIFLVRYSGLALLLNGILLFVVSWKSSSSLREKDWLLAESVLDILFAACLLFNPFLTFLTYALLIGPWMIGRGILKTLAAVTLKQTRGWIFILFTGLLSIIFGFLIIFYPLKKANGITVFIGFFALVMGLLYIFDAIRFRNFARTLNLVL
jgi:membrane protein HdeD